MLRLKNYLIGLSIAVLITIIFASLLISCRPSKKNKEDIAVEKKPVIIAEDELNNPVLLVGKPYSKARENDGIAEVKVLLTKGSSNTITVPFKVSGSAVGSGSDYSGPTPAAELTFAPWEMSKTVQFTIIDDTAPEPDKTIVVCLEKPTNATLSKYSEHRITLLDDDDIDTRSGWYDPFYCFRTPITVTVPSAGEYELDITPQMITNWMNEDTDFQFKYKYFDYDNVKLVEIDSGGNIINADVDAGYELKIGTEKIVNGDFENGTTGWTISSNVFQRLQNSYNGSYCINVLDGGDKNNCSQAFTPPANTWYKFSFWEYDDASFSCNVIRNPLSHLKEQPIPSDYYDHYAPQNDWHKMEYFFFVDDKTTWTDPRIIMQMLRFPGRIDDVSLKECEVQFVFNTSSTGTKQYMLYYSPMENINTKAPSRIRETIFPGTLLSIARDGASEWLNEGIEYSVASTGTADVWYALPTRKVLKDASIPSDTRGKVSLSCARNEKEALQLVFVPKTTGEITSVSASLTGPDNTTLTPEQFDIRQAKYININTPSKTGLHYLEPSRSEFTGYLPDPLVDIEPISFNAGDTHILIWVDINVPKDVPAGLYSGQVIFTTTAGIIDVPVELIVWDFALPDRPSFRSALQMQMYSHSYLFPFHKVTTTQDKYDLYRAYYAKLAYYKMSPFYGTSAYAHYPSTPPPDTYPEFATQLPWLFDKIYATACAIGKYSGWMGSWTQQKRDDAADSWDTRARYLSDNGWIDYAFVGVDEPRSHSGDKEAVRLLIDTCRTRPYAKYIKWFVYTYHADSWDFFRTHMDIITQSNGDRAPGGVSPKGAAIIPPDSEHWIYWTDNTHAWIDSPGINHRIRVPKLKAFDVKGFSVWSIMQWWTVSGRSKICDNPWIDPRTSWGNGQLAFFYPPSPLGTGLPTKDMSIIPSLRLVLTRDGIEDAEYVTILEKLIQHAESKDIDTSEAVKAINMMQRPIHTPVSWALSEVYWEDARKAVANAIENLAASVSTPQ